MGTLVQELERSREPSLRWKLRVQVLGEDRDSLGIRRLEGEILRAPRTRALLARRMQLGRPGTARRVYYKWQGIHWVLASLADLGYPPGDERLFPLRDRLLELWLRPGYFQEYEATTMVETRRTGVPHMLGRYRRCASQQGGALLSLTRLGLLDERSDSLVERLLHWQWEDGGWNCDRHPEADTSSFMETRLPMLGLNAYAQARRSSSARAAAEQAAEVFLVRHLFKRVRDGRVILPGFIRLHYPLYYHYDFLGGLRAMAMMDKINDPRCVTALDLLEEKRLPEGGWPAEARYYHGASSSWGAGIDYVDWGGVSSRHANDWVTVDALSVLAAAGRITP